MAFVSAPPCRLVVGSSAVVLHQRLLVLIEVGQQKPAGRPFGGVSDKDAPQCGNHNNWPELDSLHLTGDGATWNVLDVARPTQPVMVAQPPQHGGACDLRPAGDESVCVYEYPSYAVWFTDPCTPFRSTTSAPTPTPFQMQYQCPTAKQNNKVVLPLVHTPRKLSAANGERTRTADNRTGNWKFKQ